MDKLGTTMEEGGELPSNIPEQMALDMPSMLAAAFTVSMATWAAPHPAAKDLEHKRKRHAHIYGDIFYTLPQFRILRGVARELVWYDSATAVGVLAGGLDLAGGAEGTEKEKLEAKKAVSYGLQAGTISLEHDLPPVAYATCTDQKGVCVVVAHLVLGDDGKVHIAQWSGEDFGDSNDAPLKLDVWKTPKELGEEDATDG